MGGAWSISQEIGQETLIRFVLLLVSPKMNFCGEKCKNKRVFKMSLNDRKRMQLERVSRCKKEKHFTASSLKNTANPSQDCFN
jgi:hypothetical protein